MKTSEAQDLQSTSFPRDWRERYFAGEPLRLGTEVQFLFDDYAVEDRYGLHRVVGPVRKHAGNPLDTGPALPWESYQPVLQDVIYDPEERLYKAWYGTMRWQEGVETGYSYSTCYAESVDGITWKKPLFDFFAWDEHDKTNLVLHKEKGCAAFKGGVYFEPSAAGPNRRFMALAKMVPPGERVRCMVRVESGDGRQWRLAPEPILFRGASDGSYSLVHNPELNVWMLYRRPPTHALKKVDFYQQANDKRHVSVSLSRDMTTWSHPRALAMPDEIDVADIDSVNVIRYGSMYLGFIGLMPNSSPDLPKHTELMWSRDGFVWERLPDRPPFIANGAPGEWDAGSISFGTMIPAADQLRLYYIGVNVPQHEKRLPRIRGTGLADLGTDRWIGQQAGPEGGYLLTRQFILEGDQLEINSRSPIQRPPSPELAPLIRAELLQQPQEHNPATPYPGFSMEECDPIMVTDNPRQALTWNGSPDLSSLRGKPIYIRFYVRSATLYTFRVRNG